MSASVIDLEEGRHSEPATDWVPDQRLGRFERLLADLSATFINVPSDQLDAGIRDAQQRIVDALDLDRCTLSVVEDRDLVHSREWTSLESRSGAWFRPVARVSTREFFPWTLARIQAGELVQFSSVDEMPDVRDRGNYQDDMARLQDYSWPGNIRELRNVVERAMITETGRQLTFPMPAASIALGQAQREAGGRRARARAHGAREHGLARPWGEWRSKSTRSSAHDTRGPARQARAQASATSSSQCELTHRREWMSRSVRTCDYGRRSRRRSGRGHRANSISVSAAGRRETTMPTGYHLGREP